MTCDRIGDILFSQVSSRLSVGNRNADTRFLSSKHTRRITVIDRQCFKFYRSFTLDVPGAKFQAAFVCAIVDREWKRRRLDRSRNCSAEESQTDRFCFCCYQHAAEILVPNSVGWSAHKWVVRLLYNFRKMDKLFIYEAH